MLTYLPVDNFLIKVVKSVYLNIICKYSFFASAFLIVYIKYLKYLYSFVEFY